MLEELSQQIKDAMKAKDQVRLRGLRLIKSALMLLHSDGQQHTAEDELDVLVKLAKQRKDSMAIFADQGRDDLVLKEQEELEVIETFLPQALTQEEVTSEVQQIISQVGAEGMKDMGKVMGIASGKLKGRADGKQIAAVVRQLLS